MYAFFTSNGAVDTQLTTTTDEAWRQGAVNVNTIFSHFANKSNLEYLGTITFERSDGELSPEIPMSLNTFTFNNVSYNGYKFVINDEWILAKAGTLKIIIRLRSATEEIIVNGLFLVDVEQTLLDEDPNITITQYNALLAAIQAGGNDFAQLIQMLPSVDDLPDAEDLAFDETTQTYPLNGRYYGVTNGNGLTYIYQVIDDTLTLVKFANVGTFRVKASGAILKGEAVQFAGVQGDHIIAKKAVPAEINVQPYLMMGIAIDEINNNDFGLVMFQGELEGIDTSDWEAIAETLDGGSAINRILYFDSANEVAGKLTPVKVTDADKAVVVMSAVEKWSTGNSSNGKILIRLTFVSARGSSLNIQVSDTQPQDQLVGDLWYDILN